MKKDFLVLFFISLLCIGCNGDLSSPIDVSTDIPAETESVSISSDVQTPTTTTELYQQINILGNGIFEDFKISHDGEIVAVVTPLGAWLYDTENLNLMNFFPNPGSTSLSWSPDNKRIVIGGHNGKSLIFDVESGNELINLDSINANKILSLDWSPDGSKIASGGTNSRVVIWDADSGTELEILEGHTGYIFSVAWSPDGSKIASGDFDETIRIWDAQNGEVIHIFEDLPGRVQSLEWSPDGKKLASGVGKIRIFDLESGKYAEMMGYDMNDISWSPDGSKIASEVSHDLAVFDVEQGEILMKLDGHGGYYWKFEWTPDGESVIGANWSGQIFVWNAITGEEVRELIEPYGIVNDVAWSQDSKRIAIARNNGILEIWDSISGKILDKLTCPLKSVTTVYWSPDGNRIAAATSGRDPVIRVWDDINFENYIDFEGHRSGIDVLEWSHDGKMLASGDSTGYLKVWEVESGLELLSSREHTQGVERIWWIENTPWIAAWDGYTLAIWDVNNLSELPITKLEYTWSGGDNPSPTDIDFSQEAMLFVFVFYEKPIQLWDPVSGVTIAEFDNVIEGDISHYGDVEWSPDGSTYAVISTDLSLIRDRESGEVLSIIEAEVNRQFSWLNRPWSGSLWSLDGTKFVTENYDGEIRIWDIETQEELAVLEGHTNYLIGLRWSPDGTMLATYDRDGVVRVWLMEDSGE